MEILLQEKSMKHKKNYLSISILCLIFLQLCLTFSCHLLPLEDHSEKESISIISWNLQTFFDATTEGTEYSDFKGSKSTWSKEKYENRINYLCEFIQKHNADFYAFTELENASILQDISNHLNNLSFLGSEYKFACFGKNPGGVFGCGVISKYPLSEVKLHNIDYADFGKQPELRPILEITASSKEKNFSLFVCHWKSKSGGEEETDIWRDFQESLLVSCLKKCKNKQVVICGDFNRDLEEFYINKETNKIHFRNFNSSNSKQSKNQKIDLEYDENLGFINPWISSTEKGSYNFNNEWNKIDHFFISENIDLLDFSVISDFTNENGFPIKYSVRSGKGYSDHLPIRCVLTL